MFAFCVRSSRHTLAIQRASRQIGERHCTYS